MSRIEQIEHEIQNLSRVEFEAFRSWFREYDAEEWDKQIEEDVQAGRLDKLAKEALTAHKAGRSEEL